MIIKLILFGIWALSSIVCLYDLWKNQSKSPDSGSSLFICVCPIVNTLICIGIFTHKPKTRDEMILDEVMYIMCNRRTLMTTDEYDRVLISATRIVDEELGEIIEH